MGSCGGVAGGLSLIAFISRWRGSDGRFRGDQRPAGGGDSGDCVDCCGRIAGELLRLIGFFVAGAAIWLIAAEPGGAGSGPDSGPGTLWLAVVPARGSAVFCGVEDGGGGGPVWAMATARMGSLTTCSLLLAALSLKDEVRRASALPGPQ